jgi:nucleoside-diphosphate-sugar epimerase
VRDFAALAARVLADEQLEHEVFLVSAADSGHQDPTPEVIARYYPRAERRYQHLEERSPFVSIQKARRLLGWEPRHSWRDQQK